MEKHQLFDYQRAMLSSNLPTNVKFVVLTLSIHMKVRTLVAFPSQRTLAKLTGYSTRHVRRLLKQAVEAGWLQKRKRQNGRGLEYLGVILVSPARGREDRADIHERTPVTGTQPDTRVLPIRTSRNVNKNVSVCNYRASLVGNELRPGGAGSE